MNRLKLALKNGNIQALKILVNRAKQNPSDPFNRTILNELNYLNSTENAVSTEIKEEFNSLLAELIAIIKK